MCGQYELRLYNTIDESSSIAINVSLFYVSIFPVRSHFPGQNSFAAKLQSVNFKSSLFSKLTPVRKLYTVLFCRALTWTSVLYIPVCTMIFTNECMNKIKSLQSIVLLTHPSHTIENTNAPYLPRPSAIERFQWRHITWPSRHVGYHEATLTHSTHTALP